jgi:hypothetical protein
VVQVDAALQEENMRLRMLLQHALEELELIRSLLP